MKQFKEWIKEHPIISAFIGGGLVALIVVWIVRSRTKGRAGTFTSDLARVAAGDETTTAADEPAQAGKADLVDSVTKEVVVDHDDVSPNSAFTAYQLFEGGEITNNPYNADEVLIFEDMDGSGRRIAVKKSDIPYYSAYSSVSPYQECPCVKDNEFGHKYFSGDKVICVPGCVIHRIIILRDDDRRRRRGGPHHGGPYQGPGPGPGPGPGMGGNGNRQGGGRSRGQG